MTLSIPVFVHRKKRSSFRAQMLLSKATRDDAEKTIKASDFADDKAGDQLAESDSAIRVEFVHAPRAEKAKESE